MQFPLKKYSFLPFVCLFYSVYLVVLVKGCKDGTLVPVTQVNTLAGSGISGFADGPGPVAQFALPTGVCTDSKGNVYVADFGNHRIRKINPEGMVSTLAGNGTAGFKDGGSLEAQFKHPVGVAADEAGNVYVTDQENHSIRKISLNGQVTTLAGNGKPGFADGNGASSRFAFPAGIGVDKKGNIYVADRDNHRVRMISPSGLVSTMAGNGLAGFAEGKGIPAQFHAPNGIAINLQGTVFVAEYIGNRIRKISPAGEVSTLAGNGQAGYNDGADSTAQFNRPSGIEVDNQGNLYVADAGNSCIRLISASGSVSTLAGTGEAEFTDNQGILAQFNFPAEIAISPAGHLYVADANNRRIRQIKLR